MGNIKETNSEKREKKKAIKEERKAIKQGEQTCFKF